jgi:hypothetical protein
MTTATRDVKELEAEILRAHEAGDKAELAKLQAEYRSGGFTVERVYHGPGAVTLRDAQRSSTRSTPKVSGGAGIAVVIAADADEAIRESDLDDGREQSGGLYGYEANGQIVIATASVTRDQLRLRYATELDIGQLEEMEAHFRSVGWRLLGHWHSHPAAGIPASTDDRRNWQEWADSRGRGWLGVIVEPQHSWLHGQDWVSLGYRAFYAQPGASELRVAGVVIETRSSL